MNRFSDQTLAKARRLVAEQAVTKIAPTGIIFRVVGDHGQYVVAADADDVDRTVPTASCTCPTQTPFCSHVAAVLLVIRATLDDVPPAADFYDDDPFALADDLAADDEEVIR